MPVTFINLRLTSNIDDNPFKKNGIILNTVPAFKSASKLDKRLSLG